MTADGPDCVKATSLQEVSKVGFAGGHGIAHQTHEWAEVFEICDFAFCRSCALRAQLSLNWGKMGFTQDLAKSWKWFELAAKQGDGKASFMLARMVAPGQGVPRGWN